MDKEVNYYFIIDSVSGKPIEITAAAHEKAPILNRKCLKYEKKYNRPYKVRLASIHELADLAKMAI